jgi:uncharacterized membrane protein affecting hemolysin expression
MAKGANSTGGRMTYDPHKTTTEVRQGNKRQMNLRVLLISMGAVIVLFAIIFFVFFANQPTPQIPAQP